MTTNPRAKIHYLNPSAGFKSTKERAEFLASVDNKDLEFTVLYWEIGSVGSVARDILALAEVDFKNTYPSDEDWEAGKVETAFSVLPMLTIKSKKTGQELVLSESMIIDMFLAERFGLMGDDEWEKLAISSFYSNLYFLRERTFSEVQDVPKDFKKQARDGFFKYTLRKFLEDHEYHLLNNGNNGHYVGNKLSLADLFLWNVVHYYSTLPWGEMVLEKFRECKPFWKVYETVDKLQNPGLVAWRNSAEFRKLEEGSLKWYLRATHPGEENIAAPVAAKFNQKTLSDATAKLSVNAEP
ncbi:Glutathione S-transferase S1 [Gryganskiella cystojenkinii]|nr:Glutathione S-transferase S1 [Gryganskiella cystojenkinii]